MHALKVYSNDSPGNTIFPSHTPPAFRPVAVRVPCAQVSGLLQKARQNDITIDQPYMPLEKTTLQEAIAYLRRHDTILVQNGRIDYVLGNFTLKVLGTQVSRMGTVIAIQWWEVLRLLKANYAPRRVVKAPTLTSNRAPVSMVLSVPPCPIVQEGVGLVAYRRMSTDFDTIPATEWQEVYLDPTGLEKFMGRTLIGSSLVNVFWSDEDVAFLAQRA